VPANWEVVKQDPALVIVRDPVSRGTIADLSYEGEGEITLAEFQQDVVSSVVASSPDAEFCLAPEPGRVPGLPIEGSFFAMCYTVTPQGGEAFRIVSVYSIAVQGRTVFFENLRAASDQYDAMFEAWLKIPSPIWKLYRP
jgi:hypothetical protein